MVVHLLSSLGGPPGSPPCNSPGWQCRTWQFTLKLTWLCCIWQITLHHVLQFTINFTWHLTVSTPGHPAVHLALAAYLALVHLAFYFAACFALHLAPGVQCATPLIQWASLLWSMVHLASCILHLAVGGGPPLHSEQSFIWSKF